MILIHVEKWPRSRGKLHPILTPPQKGPIFLAALTKSALKSDSVVQSVPNLHQDPGNNQDNKNPPLGRHPLLARARGAPLSETHVEKSMG